MEEGLPEIMAQPCSTYPPLVSRLIKPLFLGGGVYVKGGGG